MAIPSLKLYYFDIEGGAGAPIRNAFKISGIKFEDVKFPMDTWAEVRKLESRYLYQQVPVLEVDGVPCAQSTAILRYVGKLSGLYPTSLVDALRVDEIIDCFVEMRGKLSVQRILPADLKSSVRERIADFIQGYYGMIEKRVAANASGYCVGSKLTIADLVLFNDATSAFYGAEFINFSELPAISRVISNVKTALE